MTDIPELAEQDFGRGLKRSQRRRIMQGKIESGDDVAALRRFVGLTQKDFAEAQASEILSCGTCLDYHDPKDRLQVGQPTNIRDTVAAMRSFGKVLQP